VVDVMNCAVSARRRHHAAALLATISVVAVALAGIPVARVWCTSWDYADAPAGPPWLDWPVVGSGGANLAARAQASWDAAAGGHTDVTPLALDDTVAGGPIAVLQGRDQTGRTRLAILTGVAKDRNMIVLRADRPLPDRASTRQISMVTDRLAERPGELPSRRGEALALVLAWPAAARVRVEFPGAIPATTAKSHFGRLMTSMVPDHATAFTTRIIVEGHHGEHVEEGADDDSVNTRQGLGVTLIGKLSQGVISVRADAGGARVGQLVTTRLGVVGIVTAAYATTATVALLTNQRFEVTASSAGIARAIVSSRPSGLVISSMVGGADPKEGETLFAYNNDVDGVALLPMARIGAMQRRHDIATVPLEPYADVADLTELYVVAVPT